MNGAIKKEVFIGDCRMLLGDCIEILPTLGQVDVVVTDPPYGIGLAEWDMHIAPVDGWLPAARNLAPVVLFCGVKGAFDYPKPDWIGAWVRRGSTQRNGKLRGFNNWEPILMYGLQSLLNDVIEAPNFPTPDIAHPTVKPLKLVSSLLGLLPAGSVLDPFMGSGTTGVACVKSGRPFIGIEREPSYFHIACKRIEEAYSQPDIFLEANKAALTQQGLLDGEDAA